MTPTPREEAAIDLPGRARLARAPSRPPYALGVRVLAMIGNRPQFRQGRGGVTPAAGGGRGGAPPQRPPLRRPVLRPRQPELLEEHARELVGRMTAQCRRSSTAC